MPHVLYNHITHTWDEPDLDDGWNETDPHPGESAELGAATRRLLGRLALGVGTALASLVFWGLIAGLLLGVS